MTTFLWIYLIGLLILLFTHSVALVDCHDSETDKIGAIILVKSVFWPLTFILTGFAILIAVNRIRKTEKAAEHDK